VVEKIKKHRLKTIPIPEHIRRANAYLWFYNISREERQWYVKAPYEVKRIVNSKRMPDKFQEDYTTTPVWFSRLVKKYCLKKEKPTDGM
jgi:hypothetical protein